MESIRILNLRCLADSTPIEIRPISLLVGANSSGKSTFLRLFPLLKQSHEMKTLGGLVLNEGDVNFGFFNEAVRKDADPAELGIEFSFTLRRGFYQGRPWNQFLIDSLETSCELTYVKRAKDARYPSLRAVRLSLTGGNALDIIEMTVDEDGKILTFRVNDLTATDQVSALRLRIGSGVVPRLVVALDKDATDTELEVSEPGVKPFDRRLLAETDTLFHGKTAAESRLALFNNIPVGSPERMLHAMRADGALTWRDRVKGWNVDTPSFQKVRNLILAKRTGNLLESVNVYVNQFSRSVHYFQPIRASVQRDYLSRDVSVTSVDPIGSNVAMVLSSMGTAYLDRFREWMRRYFGFEVFPQSVGDGARIALRMKEAGGGTEFNLADTGFGFSQMLPFVVQIWSLVEGRASHQRRAVYPGLRNANTAYPTSYLIAIEQPELHLHPALQSKLADLIVAISRKSREENLPIRFMLETHSPTIIERIGQSVESHALRSEDVQVVLFELDRGFPNNNTAKVRTTSFDSNGVLQDWPFGFLSAPISEPAL